MTAPRKQTYVDHEVTGLNDHSATEAVLDALDGHKRRIVDCDVVTEEERV